MHIFLTGVHDSGKTYSINNIIAQLTKTCLDSHAETKNIKIGGFKTYIGEEFAPQKSYVYMCPIGKKEGSFAVALRDKTSHGFTKYPEAFDKDGVALLNDSIKSDIIIMDELGFMESEALIFQDKVFELLDGNTPVLGAIKPDKNPFLNKVRNHKNVMVCEITKNTNERIVSEVTSKILNNCFSDSISDNNGNK